MADEAEDQGYEEFIVDEYLTEPVELVRATRVIEEPARPDMADIQLPPVGEGGSNVGVAEPTEVVLLRADNERLRARIHEIADEVQRRMAPYQSRCAQHDSIVSWAREHMGMADPKFWSHTSAAIRSLVVAIVEERDQALAELDAERAKTAGIHQGTHAYLSTSCLHGEHDYCSAADRPDGTAKTPATCKFCRAACLCPCHEPGTTTEATDADRT